MNDAMHEPKFPGMKDKSSFLLKFIRTPQWNMDHISLAFHGLLKPIMVRKQSQNVKVSWSMKKTIGVYKRGNMYFLMNVNMKLFSMRSYVPHLIGNDGGHN